MHMDKTVIQRAGTVSIELRAIIYWCTGYLQTPHMNLVRRMIQAERISLPHQNSLLLCENSYAINASCILYDARCGCRRKSCTCWWTEDLITVVFKHVGSQHPGFNFDKRTSTKKTSKTNHFPGMHIQLINVFKIINCNFHSMVEQLPSNNFPC